MRGGGDSLIKSLKFSLFFKIHSEISKVQDDEVGDGTTSVTVLDCELLRVNKKKLIF